MAASVKLDGDDASGGFVNRRSGVRFPASAQENKNLADPSKVGAQTRRTNRWLQRFWSRVDRSGGEASCWLWKAAKTADGYGRSRFDGRDQQAHRVAYQLLVGPIPDGQVVRHKVCDNPPCVNPAHLLLGTRLDNQHDAMEKQRHTHGERMWSARLNREQVEDIRLRFRNGDSRYSLADRFGVSHRQICYIVKGLRWKESP